jgi:hypothetical protein
MKNLFKELEHWSIGRLKYRAHHSIIPLFHHSIGVLRDGHAFNRTCNRYPSSCPCPDGRDHGPAFPPAQQVVWLWTRVHRDDQRKLPGSRKQKYIENALCERRG